MLHRFRHSIASFSLPTRLNNPFHYTPHPLCELAARELQAYLCERKEWTEELSAGKMFGVLVVKDSAGTVGFLTAFSGNLAGSNSHEYFVPPIYDMLRPGDLFRTEEAAISDLNRQIETLETDVRYRGLLRTIEETETEAAREIAAAKARMRIAKTAREARRREQPGRKYADGFSPGKPIRKSGAAPVETELEKSDRIASRTTNLHRGTNRIPALRA